MAGSRKAPKRRKSSAPKRKSTKKTEEGQKETTKKSPAPAKKPAPKAEEKVEEEDLDLDNLEQYNLAELKKYCEDEAIEVKGKGKKDYIAAILAYNEADDEEEH